MKASALALTFLSVLGIASANAASLYIGDAAAEGLGITAGGDVGPDGAGSPAPGAITYGFYATGYTNASGAAQQLAITEANFWSRNGGVTLTPFVAVYNGGAVTANGAVGANYNVLARGDGIVSVADLNNAAFLIGGANPIVTLNAGDTLIGGFHQDGQAVPWTNDVSVGDYLDEGDEVPSSGALTENAEWSNLGREYRFNVGFDLVPEPSSTLLLIPALAGMLLTRRRR